MGNDGDGGGRDCSKQMRYLKTILTVKMTRTQASRQVDPIVVEQDTGCSSGVVLQCNDGTMIIQ